MADNNTFETSQIIASALLLPLDGRISLLNAVLDSVEHPSEELSQSELDQSWTEEIAQRIEDIESGNVETVSSKDLWKMLGGKPNGDN